MKMMGERLKSAETSEEVYVVSKFRCTINDITTVAQISSQSQLIAIFYTYYTVSLKYLKITPGKKNMILQLPTF